MSKKIWTDDEIRNAQIKLFDTKEQAKNFFCQYGRCKSHEIVVKKDPKEFVEFVKNIHYSTSSYTSYDTLGFESYAFRGGNQTAFITLSEKITVAYKENDQKKFISFFDVFYDGKISDILDWLNKNPESIRSVIYNMALSHYFVSENYKGFSTTLSKFINGFSEIPDDGLSVSVSERGSLCTTSRMSRDLIYTRIYAYIASAILSNKINVNKNSNKEIVSRYFKNLIDIDDTNNVDLYLSNSVNQSIHTKLSLTYKNIYSNITEKVKKNGRKHRTIGDMNMSIELLESSPETMERLLGWMPVERDDNRYYYFSSWNYCMDGKSNRIDILVDELKADKERAIEVFKAYLYSKYALNQKTVGLELTLKRIQKLFSYLDMEDVSLLTLVDELPEKIRAYALSAVIDF